jgi:hypothetical protein
MWGREDEWIVWERERKNKKYEPITNPASKASDVEQGVEMSTMVTDNIGNTIFYFHSMNNKHTCDQQNSKQTTSNFDFWE